MTNTGTVEATGTGMLDLQNATISGGTVKTVGSGDVIEATVGTSTIENTTNFSNAGTLEANGGGLDLTGDTITNTGKLLATDNSLLVLNGDTIANSNGGNNGTVEVDNGSTLDLESASITGGNLTVAGLFIPPAPARSTTPRLASPRPAR